MKDATQPCSTADGDPNCPRACFDDFTRCCLSTSDTLSVSECTAVGGTLGDGTCESSAFADPNCAGGARRDIGDDVRPGKVLFPGAVVSLSARNVVKISSALLALAPCVDPQTLCCRSNDDYISEDGCDDLGGLRFPGGSCFFGYSDVSACGSGGVGPWTPEAQSGTNDGPSLIVIAVLLFVFSVARGESNALCALADDDLDRFYDAGSAVARFRG